MVSRPTHYNTRYKHDLTPRQRQVLDLIARGYTNAEIAVTLDVSLDGAKWHVSEILTRLGVDTREQAADYWRTYNRPLAKAARAFAGLGGRGLLKIAAGTVAVTAVAAAGIAVYAALRDGGPSQDGPAASTVASGETPSTGVPIPEAARRLANDLADAIARGDVPAIAAMNRPTEYTCPGAPGSTPVPVCDDGQEHHLGMISVDGAGQAAIYPLPRFEGRLRQDVTPALRLKTIGCRANDPACSSFVLGFEYANAPGTGLYFAFEPWSDGGKTGIFAHGTIGRNSGAALIGGSMKTILGETTFTAVESVAQPAPTPAQPEIPQDVRATAERLAALVTASDVAGLLGMSSPQQFTCPGGRAEGGAPLCDGAATGEVRQGFRFTMHGSEGEVRSPAGFEQELRARIRPDARLVSIGCGDGKDCSAGFVVAFAQPEGEQPAVFYFALSYGKSADPKIVGYGLSGDNASDIINGGPTYSGLGSTFFVPVK